jgi:hypothetical protein
MPIQSIATAYEENSPFYKVNKEICIAFDAFITKNGGQTRGKYGASAYSIRGKIPHPCQWEFKIKKSTFTSTGNLLLSGKSQSLFVASRWTAQNIPTDCPSFRIRKKRWLDFFRIQWSRNWSKLYVSDRYVIQTSNPKNLFIHEVVDIIQDLFKEQNIMEITFHQTESAEASGSLQIDLNTEGIKMNYIQALLEKSF